MKASTWNRRHPIGTAVRYRPTLDKPPEPLIRHTRSEAWELGHGAAVVKITGIVGGVLCEALDVVERACRACGCTDDDCRQCIEKTGQPCSWVEDDLCSACVPAGEPAP